MLPKMRGAICAFTVDPESSNISTIYAINTLYPAKLTRTYNIPITEKGLKNFMEKTFLNFAFKPTCSASFFLSCSSIFFISLNSSSIL